jgi:hypothetical protein
MVFLFPGILFRRTFFSGKFHRHFSSGNVFERILWGILLSLVAIVCFSFFVFYFKGSKILPIQFNIGFTSKEVIDTFTNLYENRFPDNFKRPDFLAKAIKFLFSLYAFSALIGFLMNRVIFYLGLEKKFNFLSFQNSWEHLFNSNQRNNSSHSIRDIYSTKVDIKTKGEQLFTGTLHEVIFDKDGKVEAFAIQEAYKYFTLEKGKDDGKIMEISAMASGDDPNVIVHSRTNSQFIYRRRVKGNIFTISNGEIENVSITYIKVSDFLSKFKKYISIFVSLLLLFITVFSIAYAIWDFGIIDFSTPYRRVGFAILTPFFSTLVMLFVFSLFNFSALKKDKKRYLNDLKNSFLILLIFTVPYIYPLFEIGFWRMTLIWFFTFMFLSIFLEKKAPSKNQDNQDQSEKNLSKE